MTVPKTVPRPSGELSVMPPRPRPEPPPFALEDPEPGQRVVLRGRLDVAVAADTRLALARALAGGAGDLVLDLARLEQVDATGLGVLVGAHRAAGRAGRSLVLRDVPPQVHRLLRATRLHRVIRTERSAPAASTCA